MVACSILSFGGWGIKGKFENIDNISLNRKSGFVYLSVAGNVSPASPYLNIH
jgi:hypothetical protein